MVTMVRDAGVSERELIRTARITGLFYLGIIVPAIVGFFIIRGQMFDPGVAAATLNRLAERELVARIGLVMELGTATCMALLALWFCRLFRSVDGFLAVAVMVLGEFNAVGLFASTAFLSTALDVALDPSLGGAAATAQLMYVMSGSFWHVGTVAAGLWLIPMGLLVLRSGWMPRLMGWLLIAGGIGYVLRAFMLYLAPDAETISSVLILPTFSEFWMAGYLLVRGIRQ